MRFRWLAAWNMLNFQRSGKLWKACLFLERSMWLEVTLKVLVWLILSLFRFLECKCEVWYRKCSIGIGSSNPGGFASLLHLFVNDTLSVNPVLAFLDLAQYVLQNIHQIDRGQWLSPGIRDEGGTRHLGQTLCKPWEPRGGFSASARSSGLGETGNYMVGTSVRFCIVAVFLMQVALSVPRWQEDVRQITDQRRRLQVTHRMLKYVEMVRF